MFRAWSQYYYGSPATPAIQAGIHCCISTKSYILFCTDHINMPDHQNYLHTNVPLLHVTIAPCFYWSHRAVFMKRRHLCCRQIKHARVVRRKVLCCYDDSWPFFALSIVAALKTDPNIGQLPLGFAWSQLYFQDCQNYRFPHFVSFFSVDP